MCSTGSPPTSPCSTPLLIERTTTTLQRKQQTRLCQRCDEGSLGVSSAAADPTGCPSTPRPDKLLIQRGVRDSPEGGPGRRVHREHPPSRRKPGIRIHPGHHPATRVSDSILNTAPPQPGYPSPSWTPPRNPGVRLHPEHRPAATRVSESILDTTPQPGCQTPS
jgi:hypothetical protein